MTGFKYPKGSEWRKWDLHVHTKSDPQYTFSAEHRISTREQTDNDYPTVFIEHLYSFDNLGALAITDHNSAIWIDKIIEENKEYATQNNRQEINIFPGVEVESSDGIHLLVIFNPDSQLKDVKENYRKPTWEDTIAHFLTAIEVNQGSNSTKTTESILEIAEAWDALCIFAHVTSDKGFFKITSGTSKIRIYKHRLAQIFQIPINGVNDGQENIVTGRDTNYCDEQGNPKSVICIASSDAKKLNDIGKNNCWIKADPTFEGLRQIIYEPDSRVYIGEEPPNQKLERDKIIKSITISDSNNWFEDNKPMSLNEGLVSIIGGKGSGKTAILDLIAYSTNSYKCYEKNESKSKSFLKRAFKELDGTKIKVEWEDGSPDEITISNKLEDSTEEGKVRYLPQDYVDQLCSEIGKNEIERQIENVIFQKIPPENKAHYSDFKNYRDAQLKVINDRKSRITKQIEDINSKIFEHKGLIESKDNKNKQIEDIENEIKKLNAEMDKISEALKDSDEQKRVLNDLNTATEQKTTIEKKISELKAKLLKVEEISNEISVFLENSKEFVDKLKDDLQAIGIKKEDADRIKVILSPENLQHTVDARKKEIDGEIEKQKSELERLDKDIKDLNSKITLEKSKQDKIREINKALSDFKKKKDSLTEDVKKVEESEKKLPELLNDRENLFISYFELIFEEKEKLKSIYAPLENILKESSEENENLFDFTVQFNINVNTMAGEGHNLIDLRHDGLFRQSKPEALEEKIKSLSFKINLDNPKISDNDKNSIKDFLKKILELFEKDGRTISSQLKQDRYNELDFDNWFYSTKYFDISYSIKFNGIDLDNLSPGLKGVALLILFLELDEEDRRPILIDQPEENLDNRSVFNTLVKYFRNAKERRQVVIATHNPNLVVNTDSEQIFVANFERSLERQASRISYVSGALENTFKDDAASLMIERQGIKEHVCEILEGGKEAFEKRERKYGFKIT